MLVGERACVLSETFEFQSFCEFSDRPNLNWRKLEDEEQQFVCFSGDINLNKDTDL